MSKPAGRAALAFIFVSIVLDIVAFGIVIPVLPKLVESFVNNDSATAAKWVGLFGRVWALMQFLCAPVLGPRTALAIGATGGTLAVAGPALPYRGERSTPAPQT